MANIKFSQFTQKTTLGTVDFLVGYTGAQNIQIDPVDLLSSYPTGSGGTGRVAFWEPSNNLSSDYLFKWDNSSNRLGLGVETPTATLHAVTADDTIAKFESSDNKAAISISDDDTTGYFSAENGRIGIGTGLGASSSNISILTSNSNVGIGTVSPAAKLEVDGTFISTGISQIGSGGSNVYLTSSSAGNVGIGTSSPNQKLQVNGSVNADSYKISNTTVLSGSADVYVGSGGGTGRVFLNNTSGIGLALSGANIGIGTTSPTAKLHIQSSDNAATANLIYLENIGSGGSEGVSIKFNPMFNAESMIASNREGAVANACNLTFHTYNNAINEAMRITSAGKVGIGTTTPAGIFEVFEQGTGRTTGDLLVDATSKYVYVGRLSTTSGDVCSFKVRDRLDRAYFDVNTASKYISFNPEIGNITMTLAQGYGLGVGTTSPEQRLHVASVSDQYIAKFSHSTATGYAPGSILLEASQGDSRGQGIFHYNTVADDSWFTGVPYNVASTKWIVSHKPDTTFNPDVAQLSHALLTIDSATNNVGIGTSSPASRLEVDGGDIEVDDSGSGLILKSPDGTRYRVTVANGGTLSVSAV